MTTETIRCRECGREIRFVRLGWGHVENPRQNHHYAVPSRISEQREQTGSPPLSSRVAPRADGHSAARGGN